MLELPGPSDSPLLCTCPSSSSPLSFPLPSLSRLFPLPPSPFPPSSLSSPLSLHLSRPPCPPSSAQRKLSSLPPAQHVNGQVKITPYRYRDNSFIVARISSSLQQQYGMGNNLGARIILFDEGSASELFSSSSSLSQQANRKVLKGAERLGCVKRSSGSWERSAPCPFFPFPQKPC